MDNNVRNLDCTKKGNDFVGGGSGEIVKDFCRFDPGKFF